MTMAHLAEGCCAGTERAAAPEMTQARCMQLAQTLPSSRGGHRHSPDDRGWEDRGHRAAMRPAPEASDSPAIDLGGAEDSLPCPTVW